MAYSVKVGSGQSLVSLVAFDPQPRCLGLQYTRVTPMADSSMVREGPFFELAWDIFEDATQYVANLTLCGLNAANKVAVTVYGPDQYYSMARYNANAHIPIVGQSIGRRNFFIRDGLIRFTDLVAL